MAGIALQRSLVPERLPEIPGLELASRYLPAEDGGVGGDWYDIFTVPSGQVCITVGDVVGRGLRAAVVMGRLRSTVRAYAMEILDPPALIERVDRKLQHFEPSEMATVLFAVLDPTLRRMRIALAGHPAPLLALPAAPGQEPRPATMLDLPVDPPLGTGRTLERHGKTVDIPAGAVLCFFTDGLVERRRTPLDERLRLLAEHVTADAPDQVCQRVMDGLVPTDSTSDDIAVVALRRLEPSSITDLAMDVPAVPAALRDIRMAMRRWLATVGAGPEDIMDLLTAVGEASSNAVEHAYGARRGSISLRVERKASSGEIVARVRDTGGWRQPRGTNRGRGLRLMEAASDGLAIHAGTGGTEVVIRRYLRGPSPGNGGQGGGDDGGDGDGDGSGWGGGGGGGNGDGDRDRPDGARPR